MKKFAVIVLLLLVFASPAFAARYMVPMRSVYHGKHHIKKAPTFVEIEENRYERNYKINAGPNYKATRGITYSTGCAANYGSNITPKYNYTIKSGPHYNIKPVPARTYHSGPAYKLGR